MLQLGPSIAKEINKYFKNIKLSSNILLKNFVNYKYEQLERTQMSNKMIKYYATNLKKCSSDYYSISRAIFCLISEYSCLANSDLIIKALILFLKLIMYASHIRAFACAVPPSRKFQEMPTTQAASYFKLRLSM